MPGPSSSSVRIFYPPWTRAELIARLREAIAYLAVDFPLQRAVLFGSWARGDHTPASDVDLMLLYPGPARPDAFAAVRRQLGLPRLEPHLYTDDEYHGLKDTIDHMIAGGVDLWPPGPWSRTTQEET